jgi:hypothetical protein
MNVRKQAGRRKRSTPTNSKQVGGRRQLVPTSVPDYMQEQGPPRISCYGCKKTITGQHYQFACCLACEECVTNYYRSKIQHCSDVLSKSKLERLLAEELAFELPWRAREGNRLLRKVLMRNRRNSSL